MITLNMLQNTFQCVSNIAEMYVGWKTSIEPWKTELLYMVQECKLFESRTSIAFIIFRLKVSYVIFRQYKKLDREFNWEEIYIFNSVLAETMRLMIFFHLNVFYRYNIKRNKMSSVCNSSIKDFVACAQ